MDAKRVLIIEDSVAIAKIQKHICKLCGFEADIAISLQEARQLYEKADIPYFVAIVDYALPDANNGEAIDFTIEKHIPSIVMTGMLSNEIRDDILKRPVVDYIPKENRQVYDYLKHLLTQLPENQHIKVLVVDDSLPARMHIVRLLERQYFQVLQAENGEDALIALSQHPDISVVITDQEMPKLSGIELTREIRQKYSIERMVIIGVSGADNNSLSARFIKNGANDYLRKPFCAEEFYCRIFQNITYIKNIRTIRRQANYDYLTDLPNRRYFFTKAEKFMKNTQLNTVCTAIMDIDHFKAVNDTFGHDAGDEALKHVANILASHFDKEFIARFGGEEFCVCFKQDQMEQAHSRLDTFRTDIANSQIRHQKDQICLTISIGLISSRNKNINLLISEADKCLYQAKEAGRNQVVALAIDDNNDDQGED